MSANSPNKDRRSLSFSSFDDGMHQLDNDETHHSNSNNLSVRSQHHDSLSNQMALSSSPGIGAPASYIQNRQSHWPAPPPRRGGVPPMPSLYPIPRSQPNSVNIDNSTAETHGVSPRGAQQQQGGLLSVEELTNRIRSERKRSREKQRRTDVNEQFTNLMELLKVVEGCDLDSDVSDDEDETVPRKKSRHKKLNAVGAFKASPTNRVDLISRTVAIIQRLQTVNRTLRQTVKGLRKSMKKLKDLENFRVLASTGVGGSIQNGGTPVAMTAQMPGMTMMPPQFMDQLGMMGPQNMSHSNDGQQQVCRLELLS